MMTKVAWVWDIGLVNVHLYNQFVMSNLHELIYFYCDDIWRAARFQGYIANARSIDILAKEIVNSFARKSCLGHSQNFYFTNANNIYRHCTTLMSSISSQTSSFLHLKMYFPFLIQENHFKYKNNVVNS
jgi:hypothetical protein